MINVFIGYDSRMPVVSAVLAHSIQARSTQPVSISFVSLRQLKQVYARARNPLQSTEFSFTRFLVPYLCEFKGWAIFMDNDMLMLDDIAKLWALRDSRFAVQVVKHDHRPKESTKFLGETQTSYEKKNWSSVMLFNCEKCSVLQPGYVNTASGLELHQFKWVEDDAKIGEIPHRWNHLVGYDKPDPDVSLVHYTLGGPYFTSTHECEYAGEWFLERDAMLNIASEKTS